jgi:hypothetical protein
VNKDNHSGRWFCNRCVGGGGQAGLWSPRIHAGLVF